MSRLSSIFLIVTLIIALLVPTNNVYSSGLASPESDTVLFCGNPTTVRLLTDKNVNAGTVTVKNSQTNLFVTYTTNSSFKLTATHLAVVNSLAEIPKTSKGNPVPGQFPYQSKHNKVSTFTYTIPLAGLNNTVIVAAHADVLKTGDKSSQGAWGEGTMFNPQQRSWGMYFSYSIQPCNRPPVAANDSYSTNEDTSLTVSAPGVLSNDSDPDADPITAVLDTNTTHGTLTLNANGSFTYTPAADFNGSDSFTYKARDSFNNLSNTATVTININPVNDAPVAANDAYTVNQYDTLTVPASGVLTNDSDADGDPVTAVLVNNPAHGTLTLNTDGSFAYTPNASFFGSDSFTYKANDGTVDSNVATVTLSVSHVNTAPTANNDSYNTDEDTGLTVPAVGVLTNDTDPDLDPLTAVKVSDPAHGTVTLNADGSFSYTPDANYSGSDSFTYKANDGTANSNIATVNITINAVNDAPVATNDSYSTNEDTALNVTAPGVLSNDADVDGGSLSAILVSGVAHGTLVLNADGSFSYTPESNYSGSDSFTYKANDGTADSNVATVNITINPVNDAPTANNDSYITNENTTLTVPAVGVLTNDTDVDGDSLSAILVSGPTHGSLSLNPDGSFIYTPDSGYSGADGFTYKANDSAVDSNVATVTITITPPNAAPVAAGNSVSTNEDTLKTITLSATDAEGDTLTFSIVDSPANGSLGSPGSVNCAANTCTVDIDYTPNANFNGSDSFTFKANDGTQDSTTATINITVNAVNDAPGFTKGADKTVFEDSGAQTVNGWATSISAGPSNESGQTITFLITGNTNAGLFSAGPSVASNGDLTYTPAPDAFGSATITLVAKDDGGTANGGNDTSASQSFVITVTGVNDSPSFTKGIDQSVDEDAGAQTVNNWATGISAGPNESGQALTFVIDTNSNPSLFSAGPAVASNGTLTYTPAANQNGVANITLHVTDDGGTANGGVDASATQSFVITVNAVNDSPVAQTKTASAQANMKIVGVNPGLLTGVTDADTGINGCSPTFSVASITSNTGGTVSNVNLAVGTFDFDPAPGFTGTAVVNYTVQDNGCPGSAVSAPAAINITVSGPVIWFVNPALGVNGDGRLSNPFNSLASAAGVDATGHRIFVYTGTTPTASISLNSDEWLIGQGVSGTTFDALFGITPPAGTIARPSIAGTRPVIQGNVAMASTDTVRGLNIQPASGTEGLSASGASTLTVNEVSVTTANAAAVNLSSSGGTISLTTVNANGGSRGIILNSTTGSFTVTGTGGTCTAANTAGCSGGTIQNMTGADDSSATPIGTGVVLNNAANVSLTRMWIHDHSNYAMRGTSANGFTLDSSVVNGTNGGSTAASAGSPFNDSSIYFSNLTGSATISNTAISGGFSNNVKLVNTTGTLNRLTFSAVNIGANNTNEGNDGIGIEGQGAAVVNVTVQNSTFTSARGDLFQMNHIGSGTADLIFTGNTLSNNHPAIATGGGGVTLGNGSTSTFTMNISTNTFRDAVGHAVLIVKDIGTGSQSVTFSGNTIGVPAVANSGSLEGSDLKIQQAGDGTQTVLVSNNFMYQYNNDAILLQTGAGIVKGGNFNATVTGNTISNAGNNPSIGLPVQGINLNGGVTPGDTFAICAQIGGAGTLRNDLDSAIGPFGGGDYRIRQRQSTTVRLPGYAGSATDTTAVVTYVNGNNIVSGTGTATVSSPPGGGYVGGAACAQP